MSVTVRRDGAVAIVTIDRQEALNAMDLATVGALRDRLAEVADDDTVRCVVLTGAGDRAFVAGADIEYMSKVDEGQARAFAETGHEVGRLLETMGKPTIAAVNGFALGGGCEMALACDIRYAAPKAKFGQPEVTFGLIPGWGATRRLARATTIGFAKELIFTGRFVDAEEALRRGLIDAIAEAVLEKVLETARLIATKSPSAIAAAKALCNEALQGSHPENLRYEAAALTRVLLSEDAREGTKAFVEKREPAFARDKMADLTGNCAVVAALIEAMNAGDFSMDAFCSPDYTWFPLYEGVPVKRGLDVYREGAVRFQGSFEGFRCEILDLVGDGDKVAMRYREGGIQRREVFGFPPSDEPIHWEGFAILTFRDGKIVEERSLSTLLDVLRARKATSATV